MERYVLKEKARNNLEGNWGLAIAAMVIINLLAQASNLRYIDSSLGFAGNLIIILLIPIFVGYSRFHYNIAIGKHGDLNNLFSEFNSEKYGRAFIGMFLQSIFLIGWFLLLIIPAFIKVHSYAMTMYILQDPKYDYLSGSEAITKSRELMDGHKLEFFLLIMSFLGWLILSIFTFGLLLFYVLPYMAQTRAEFYLSLTTKNKAVDNLEYIDNQQF